MIITLYGPDDYRREQKKREIIGEFKKKHSDIGVEYFDFQDDEALENLTAFLRNQSIFETKKLAIIENAFPARGTASADTETDVEESGPVSGKNDDAKKLTAFLKSHLSMPNATILLSLKKKPTKTFAFLLKEPAIVQEFEALTAAAWGAFVRTTAKRFGADIAPGALAFLAKIYEGDAWALATEIEKLASFKSSIDENDLAVFDYEAAPNYWGLLNGAKGYDIRMRLTALEQLLAMNDPAPKIFNIMASTWREKTPQMAAYDRAIKSGKLDYEEALVDLVIA